MRVLKLFLVTTLAFLVACTSYDNSELYEKGVSEQLAVLRKKEIKELAYELFFSIPQEKDSAVAGEALLRFSLDATQPVIVDFRNDPNHIKSVTVNGEIVDCDIRNEHIIIPASASRVGKNVVNIAFVAGDQSLNRNDDFLYTLLVPDRARTLFPCFEQPNLKANFTLRLEIPAQWEAVSNSAVSSLTVSGDRKSIQFETTEPLSTYLFSFVAGKMSRCEYRAGERIIAAYHRENDEKRLAQLDIIFSQIVSSLEWMENYTGIPYPFAKYDIIILPGFQYGGMEHTGATLYNDATIFLPENPTPDEELRRASLIAHETAHMWFGDYVTMQWFDDVWTKEVFANYFASAIVEPLFPDINHSLNWLKTITAPSLSEDRTMGTTSIKQPLDNLSNAGLIYGNIIYCKAPVMMKKLVEIMGEEAFRSGIQEYLREYAYSNATWDDLVAILDEKCPEDIKSFSNVWVNEKGLPHIECSVNDGILRIVQSDPLQRGLLWPQSFEVTIIGKDTTKVNVTMSGKEFVCNVDENARFLLPNSDGGGYAIFLPDTASLQWLLDNWYTIADETARQSALMTLYENYLAKRVGDEDFANSLLKGVEEEKNPLIASTICAYLGEPLRSVANNNMEQRLYRIAQSHPLMSCRVTLLRLLICDAHSPEIVEALYSLWSKNNHPLLSEYDYMTLAYELAMRMPERCGEIISTQRSRIGNSDRQRQFDFISRAVVPDTLLLDALFDSLMEPENRRIEPWSATTLSYLNHPLQSERAVKYIRPALEELQEIQRTGDIFFPRNWVGALLGDYRSTEAKEVLNSFLNDNPNYPPLLKNKILQAAYMLQRANE